MQFLAKRIADQRRAKAEECERCAALHGADSAHGATYAREARYWRAAAAMADAGDTTARPAVPLTERFHGGQVVAMIFRPAPTGRLNCADTEIFAALPRAHEWARQRAAELNREA